MYLFGNFSWLLQPIDVSNLICLYGIHERYLNNLCQRYSEGLITDFYRYVWLFEFVLPIPEEKGVFPRQEIKARTFVW